MKSHVIGSAIHRRSTAVVVVAGTVSVAALVFVVAGVSCSKSSSATAQLGSDAACTVPDASIATDAGTGTDANSLAGLPAPSAITLTTLAKAPLVIEGLTADGAGNFYAAGRVGTPSCPVWKFDGATGNATVVGNITAPCSPNGLAFNTAGDLFIGDGSTIYELTPNDQTPPTATVFATGVPIANGLAFDRAGRLWVTDGTTAQGRVWSIATDGTVTEAFRVQPLANTVNLVVADGGTDAGPTVGGVGRDPRALPPGSLTITPTTRAAADSAGSVPVVANGIAVGADGSLFVADTARGAIWKVAVDAQGVVTSQVGCDTTFTANTLCLSNILVEHPYLEGVDGIALDEAGNIWSAANERNAIVVVTPQGNVREVFRNPPDATTMLRNGGPLEYPTSPFLAAKKLCITQSDTSRRDNFPNSAGEVGPGVTGPLLGKLSCMDQPLPTAGLALPIH